MTDLNSITDSFDQQVVNQVGIELTGVNKLDDCAGIAAANQIPFGDKVFGTPKAPADPIGSTLGSAEKLSNNKYPAMTVLALKKAGLPELAERTQNVATKIVPKLAPAAEKLSVAGWVWAGYTFARDTAKCYNKLGS